MSLRQFSSSPEEGKEKKKDLRESINRLKNESKSDSEKESSNESSADSEPDPRLEKLTSIGTSFLHTISKTWDELVASGAPKDINKKLGTPTSEEGDDPNFADDNDAADKYEKYKGSSEIMLIDPAEHLSAWERMERRLRDAPIISGKICYLLLCNVLGG